MKKAIDYLILLALCLLIVPLIGGILLQSRLLEKCSEEVCVLASQVQMSGVVVIALMAILTAVVFYRHQKNN